MLELSEELLEEPESLDELESLLPESLPLEPESFDEELESPSFVAAALRPPLP